MNKPITLVTGASRGIGFETCIELANRGHHIVALARTIGGLEDLADKIGDDNITLIPQDLSDGQALEKLGPALFEKFGRLDNFIANAGMLGTLCPLAQSDPTDWQDNMAEIYKQETADTNITVSIFDPGGTATKMRASAFPGEDPNNLPSAKDTALRLVGVLG